MTATTDWIGAVGTVGTLSTGLILFAGTIADRRRAHANAVAVWTELEVVDTEAIEANPDTEAIEANPDTEAIEANPDPLASAVWTKSSIEIRSESGLLKPFDYRLRVKNGGHQPIYACRLHVELSNQDLPRGVYGLVYNTLTANLGILGPDVEMPARSLLTGRPWAGQDVSEALVNAMSFKLSFTDTAGRAWTRDQRGHLRRARGPRRLFRRKRERPTADTG